MNLVGVKQSIRQSRQSISYSMEWVHPWMPSRKNFPIPITENTSRDLKNSPPLSTGRSCTLTLKNTEPISYGQKPQVTNFQTYYLISYRLPLTYPCVQYHPLQNRVNNNL